MAISEQALRRARSAAARQRLELDVASQRHWGRRGKQAMSRCLQANKIADDAVTAAMQAEHDAGRRLNTEHAAQHDRAMAVTATEPQRAEIAQSLRELDAALDDTRAARVAAMATQPIPPSHLAAALGEPPDNPASNQAWWGLAYRVELYRDHHPEALGHDSHSGVMAAIGPRPRRLLGSSRRMGRPRPATRSRRGARGHGPRSLPTPTSHAPKRRVHVAPTRRRGLLDPRSPNPDPR